jgi:hypothetical protein
VQPNALDARHQGGELLTVLPAGTMSFTEPPAAPVGIACFVLVPFTVTESWRSDPLCVIRESGSPGAAAHNFTVRLNQTNTLRMSWNGPPASSSGPWGFGYRINFRTEPRFQLDMGPSVNAIGWPISGPSCAQLHGGSGDSQVLCGIPGTSTIP